MRTSKPITNKDTEETQAEACATTAHQAQAETEICGSGPDGCVVLPPVACGLLMDEWRRATMEGQGGWFVRLPRERYDGQGNLWTVVRRNVDDQEKIVLVQEAKHYQAMAARNELERVKGELGHKQKLHQQVSNDLLRVRAEKNALKEARYSEQAEALAKDVDALEQQVKKLEVSMEEPKRWEEAFALDLRGVRLRVEG